MGDYALHKQGGQPQIAAGLAPPAGRRALLQRRRRLDRHQRADPRRAPRARDGGELRHLGQRADAGVARQAPRLPHPAAPVRSVRPPGGWTGCRRPARLRAPLTIRMKEPTP